jgi:alpha-amylase
MWESWITSLVSTYSIDGLRLDSAMQVDQAFWPPFQSAGIYPNKGGKRLAADEL